MVGTGISPSSRSLQKLRASTPHLPISGQYPVVGDAADQESRAEGEALLGMQSQETSPSLLVRFQMFEINPRI